MVAHEEVLGEVLRDEPSVVGNDEVKRARHIAVTTVAPERTPHALCFDVGLGCRQRPGNFERAVVENPIERASTRKLNLTQHEYDTEEEHA